MELRVLRYFLAVAEEGRMLRECAQTKSIRVPAHRHYKALVSDGSRKPPVGGTLIVDPAESQGCAAAVPGAHARTQSAAELVRTIRRSRRSSTPGITRRNAPMSFSRNW